MAAAVFVTAARGFSIASASTLTSDSFTVSGEKRAIYAWLLCGNSPARAPDTVKWNTTESFSLVTSIAVGSFRNLSLWRLVNPTATTSTIVADWTTAVSERMVVAQALSNVNQDGPNRPPRTATGTGLTLSAIADTLPNDLIIDGLYYLESGGPTNQTLTAGAGQTSRTEIDSTDLGDQGMGSSTETATGFATTMSWTLNAGATDSWGLIALNVNGASVPESRVTVKRSPSVRRNWDKGGWFNTRGHAKGWFWRGWVPATSANVTLALTGVSSAAATGALAPGSSPALIGAASVSAVNGLAGGQPLTGTSSAAAVNAPAVTHDQPLTGTGSTAAVNAPAVTHDQPLTGTGSTAAVNVLAVTHDQPLTGTSSTAAVNAPAVTHDQPLTGASSTASPGTLSPAITLALTGVAGTGAVGTVTAVTGGGSDVTVALTGVAATGVIGTAGPQISVGTSGNSAAAAAGTLIATRGHGVTGNAVAGSPGSIVASSSPALTGAAATAAVNIPAAAITVAVGGTSGTGGAGNVVVLGGTVAALTGVTGTGNVGSLGVLITGAIGPRPATPYYSNAESDLRAAAGSATRPTHQEAPRGAAGTASRRGSSAGSSSRRAGVNPAPILLSVVSRKTHGAAGDFDIVIDTSITVSGNVTIEPRTNAGGHTIVFAFDRAISIAGSVTSVDSTGAALGSASSAAVGNTVVVTLAGAANKKRCQIDLSGVNGNASARACLGLLIGDVNSSRFTNTTDRLLVAARSGETVNAGNAIYDLNLSGVIEGVAGGADRALVDNNNGPLGT